MAVYTELENIQARLKVAQQEQANEFLRLCGAMDKKFLSNSSNLTFKAKGRDDKTLSKYFMQDSFLLPETNQATLHRKLSSRPWPFAFVANFAEKTAELGNVESHGSLWRLRRHDGAGSGSNTVTIQTSEIGEKTYYLSDELELVESQDAAAKWDVKVLTLKDQKSLYTSNGMPSEHSGLFVQFTLMPPPEEELEALSGTAIQAPAPRLLVCATSAADGSSQGVAILSMEQLSNSVQRGEGLDWRVNWEILTEEAAAQLPALAEAEFLEEGSFFD